MEFTKELWPNTDSPRVYTKIRITCDIQLDGVKSTKAEFFKVNCSVDDAIKHNNPENYIISTEPISKDELAKLAFHRLSNPMEAVEKRINNMVEDLKKDASDHFSKEKFENFKKDFKELLKKYKYEYYGATSSDPDEVVFQPTVYDFELFRDFTIKPEELQD